MPLKIPQKLLKSRCVEVFSNAPPFTNGPEQRKWCFPRLINFLYIVKPFPFQLDAASLSHVLQLIFLHLQVLALTCHTFKMIALLSQMRVLLLRLRPLPM